MSVELDEDSLQELYSWVDAVPLSRPKRSIARDFSDGVLTAEMVKFHFPKLVEMHNYVPASSTQQKISNWSHLNRKVFNRLNFSVPEEVVRKVVQCSPGVVEVVLHSLRQKMEEKLKQRVNKQSSQELEYYSTESGQGAQSSTYSPQPKLTRDSNQIQHSPGPGYSQPPASPDTSARLLLEEREQALLSAQETIAILQAKVNRLQHLLHLKDIRIDELSRRLQLPQKSN
ncbi:sperm flagellar protein 1 [Amia ocellicauda]|uniref:sperm flagellar protein 1 n=1 Tax=Amia ocellicauda TaxID=2972642 RepID=UPI0034640DD8